ncbi:MAG: hypothetical protein JO307_20655, partial [Bryobacterales bacterium]|nr:hypothetical protein [Bryobacterales bacterium]
YWQVVPLLVAATGASLDLKKLQGYPIPTRQLFIVEVLLRATASLEMFVVLLGASAGILLNPRLAKTGLIAILLYVVFNLYLALGLRDLLGRLLSRRRIREIVLLILFLGIASIQFIAFRTRQLGRTFDPVGGIVSLPVWPWTAAARTAQNEAALKSFGILAAWCLVAGAFGLWQFSRSLSFDADAANATVLRRSGRPGLLERFYRFPALVFADPLGALVEKDVRFLARSPRFRMVFFMGFTFGLVVWLPTAFGRPGGAHSFFATNYLTMVSLYSLLLLSEVCLWNSFGFDRSAAQIYFLAPLPFSKVLIGKNLCAAIFISLEIAIVTIACVLLRMPIDMRRLGEALAVVVVTSIFQFAAGNLMSVREARGVNPDSSMRHNTTGRTQAFMLLVQPLAFLPAAFAFLARFAFDSEAAFFGVLAFDAIVGIIVYRIALESAVEFASREKERFLTALAAGAGPIS